MEEYTNEKKSIMIYGDGNHIEVVEVYYQHKL